MEYIPQSARFTVAPQCVLTAEQAEVVLRTRMRLVSGAEGANTRGYVAVVFALTAVPTSPNEEEAAISYAPVALSFN